MCIYSLCTLAQKTEVSHKLSIKGTMDKECMTIPAGTAIEVNGVVETYLRNNSEMLLLTKAGTRTLGVPIKKLKNMTLTPTDV